jgi:hypothetical protein
MRKTFFWQRPKSNAETISKTYELCVFGGMYYTTNLFLKNELKIRNPSQGSRLHFFKVFRYVQYTLLYVMYRHTCR